MYLTDWLYILAVLLMTTWKFGITMKKIEQDNQCNNQHLWDKLKCPIEKVFNFWIYLFVFLSFDLLTSKGHPEKSKTFSSCPFSLYVVNPKFQGEVYSLGIYLCEYDIHVPFSCQFTVWITYYPDALVKLCPAANLS